MSDLINEGKPFRGVDHSVLNMTRRELYEQVSLNKIRRVFRNVFVDTRATDDRTLRASAISLVVPPYAVVCDEWAAWLWGVDAFPPGRRHNLKPSVVVPHHKARTRLPGAECREAHIPDADRVDMEDIKVTTAVRTTTDLLRHQRRPYALASADAMVRSGIVGVDDIFETLPFLKGYPGIRQARSLAMLIDPDAASPGESWTRLRMVDAGFAIPQSQLEVIDPSGVTRFIDLAYSSQKIAVEYDGREFHSGDTARGSDDHRRAMLRATGFKFVIATYENIFGEDTAFEHELGTLLGQIPKPRSWK